jgi:hypothetical protein
VRVLTINVQNDEREPRRLEVLNRGLRELMPRSGCRPVAWSRRVVLARLERSVPWIPA